MVPIYYVGVNEKVIKTILFYISTFFSGIIIVPTLGMIAPTFILGGIIVPLSELLKLSGHIFKFDVPFINIELGSINLNPILTFILSIVIGLALYFLGISALRLLKKTTSIL